MPGHNFLVESSGDSWQHICATSWLIPVIINITHSILMWLWIKNGIGTCFDKSMWTL